MIDLPMNLQDWFNIEWNEKELERNKLIYSRAARDQIIFVRDDIHCLILRKYEDRQANQIGVVSTHLSKSCPLPVYHIAIEGLEIWMRGNFYNWIVSVKSDIEISTRYFRRMVSLDHQATSPYCEGFEDDWIFGTMLDNPKEFTIILPGTNSWLFTALWIIAESNLITS